MANYGAIGGGVGQMFGAVGTLIGADAAVDAAEANRDYLNNSAAWDIRRGNLAQADVDRQAAAVLAGQKTSYAAQNIDLSSESVSQVREETFAEAQRVKNEVELSAAMDAWGKTEQGRLGVEQAKSDRRAARIGAGGQVIGGVGSIFAGSI